MRVCLRAYVPRINPVEMFTLLDRARSIPQMTCCLDRRKNVPETHARSQRIPTAVVTEEACGMFTQSGSFYLR
ncbi:hypothetical protein E1301_Tti011550 [Triplophysa tibetana]|uniref:Uncharacterized protein n=1 Tax=Triplophysa tibetana TaxID=1572043 RepID=A0A5A9PJ36_9TELE|nr:hypothetical protein E1301_Tti011550 [Triplophysa tibetana]